MPNYNDVFLSESFILQTDESKSERYIDRRFLHNKMSFSRKDGCIEAYSSDKGEYNLPKPYRDQGMTIEGRREVTIRYQSKTNYYCAPGKNPREEDFVPLISLRKKRPKAVVLKS